MIATILIGSGHKNSRCYKIGKIFLKELEQKNFQVNLIQLSELDIKDCLGCEYCKSHQNQCVINDQMQQLYPILNKTDVLIFISPVYFSNIPGVLKKVIDRCQLYFNLIDKSEIIPKQFLAIHIGGAPYYQSQFEAFKLTYQVFLPNLKAKMIGFTEITNTDRVDPLTDKLTMNRINSEIHLLTEL